MTTLLSRKLFILAHDLGDKSFYQTYKRLMKSQWDSAEELKLAQEKHLRHMVRYSYEQVPYYHNLFKSLNLHTKDIQTIEDLEKIPILTKDIIKKNWDELKPACLSSLNFNLQATGGSTGTPLQYRISKNDRFFGAALLYRGWGYGGYTLGDPMVFLAGSSLDISTKSWLEKRIHEVARNVRKLSSFDMADAEMRHYSDVLTSFKPKFLRGYASSIYFFARWIDENDVSVPSLNGIFTTAEKLFPHMRETISEVFECEVFDNYGLNDGGVTAYECPEHSGMHIDSERSIMEIVDQDNRQIGLGQGEVLATSLHNFSMPFIRYSTGDLASITDIECSCGRHTKILNELVGRTVDIFFTPDGKKVHGWFFLVIFWEHGQGIKEYQVIQTAIDNIVIKIVLEKDFNKNKLETIKNIILSKSIRWNIQFQEVESIDRTRSGKYKFLINEMMS